MDCRKQPECRTVDSDVFHERLDASRKRNKRGAAAPWRVLQFMVSIAETISGTFNMCSYSNRNSSPRQDIWREELAVSAQ